MNVQQSVSAYLLYTLHKAFYEKHVHFGFELLVVADKCDFKLRP